MREEEESETCDKEEDGRVAEIVDRDDRAVDECEAEAEHKR